MRLPFCRSFFIRRDDERAGDDRTICDTLSGDGYDDIQRTESDCAVGRSDVALDFERRDGGFSNRIPDSTQLILNGGNLGFAGGTSSFINEQAGDLNIGGGGLDVVTVSLGGVTTGSALTFASLSHATGGMVLFRGNTLGQSAASACNIVGNILFNSAGFTLVGAGGVLAGTNTISIIPFAIAESTAGTATPSGTGAAGTFATIDANGVRPLTAAEFATAITSGSTTLTNVAPTSGQTLTGNTTINAVRFGGSTAGTVSLGTSITLGSNMLTLNSGAIYANESSASNFTGGTLAFGPGGTGEAFITVFGQSLSLNTTVQASSLTKSGTGTLVLNGTNNFSGTTYINQGTVQVAGNNELGNGVVVGSNLISASTAAFGGSLQLTGNVSYNLPLTISDSYTAGLAAGSQGGLDSLSGSNTWSGTITLTGNGLNSNERQLNTISAQTGSTLVLSGQIVEGGTTSIGVAKTGLGTLVLTGTQPNTLTELFRQFGGTIIVEKDGAFGTTNPLIIDGNFIQNGTANTLAFAERPSSGSSGYNYATEREC